MNLLNQNFTLIVSDFISLFFPNYCAVCNLTLSKSENHICTHCFSKINRTNLHKDQPNVLHNRFFNVPKLKYVLAFAWFQKGGVIQKLLHQLKYDGNEEVGLLLGEIYGEEIAPYFRNQWDLITTVPIHYSKRRKRGYNQSDLIAKGMSKSLKVPFVQLLCKSEKRNSQTRKHRIERFDNVYSSFKIINPTEKLEGKRILLVDDVITTGATLQESCQPLLSKGAEISFATIAATNR